MLVGQECIVFGRIVFVCYPRSILGWIEKLHGSCANMSHTRRCLRTMIDGGEHPTMPLILAIESS